MKPREAYKAWQDTKDRIIEMTTKVHAEVKPHAVDYRAGQYEALTEVLSLMDDKDGTQEGNNLLHDLKRGGE